MYETFFGYTLTYFSETSTLKYMNQSSFCFYTNEYPRRFTTFFPSIVTTFSTMPHSHDHHDHSSHASHDHAHPVSNISKAFFIAITINIIFVGIEVFFGVQVHSLALLSDAGHNAMDVLNLILSGIALWLSKKSNTIAYTYGYKRASIFSAFINSVLLVITALYLIFEAFARMFAPMETVGSTMMVVASIGILVNGISGWLLMR